MMDPIALRSLVAVHRSGSVGAAAVELGYTPSAVSQQIKRLETQAGVALIEKHGRGILLTEAGRLLATGATELLADLESLETRVNATGGAAVGLVHLAAFATAQRGLLPAALARLRTEHPGIDIRVREAEPWAGIELVAAGEVDLAVVHNWEPTPLDFPDSVRVELVAVDVADVLVHRSHRLAHGGAVTVADLVGESWVSVAPGSICHQWLSTMFHTIGASPRIAHTAQEFATHTALVESGLVVALVPRLGREPLPADVVALELADPKPTRKVTTVWRGSRDSSPALRAVRAAIRGTAAG